MAAITLWSPWAQWIAAGLKTVETREHGRLRSVVGRRVAIHVARQTDRQALLIASKYARSDRLLAAIKRFGDVAGHVLATAFVLDHRNVTDWHSRAALYPCSPGLYGVFLGDVRVLPEPIPACGCQLIWSWTPPPGWKDDGPAPALFGRARRRRGRDDPDDKERIPPRAGSQEERNDSMSKQTVAEMARIDGKTPVGREYEFEGERGAFDPRIQGPAKTPFAFTLRLAKRFRRRKDAGNITFANGDGTTFTLGIDHWRDSYAPAVTGVVDREAAGTKRRGASTPPPSAGAKAPAPLGRLEGPPGVAAGWTQTARPTLVRTAIDSIEVRDGANPRRHFDEGLLAELAASLGQTGQLQPIAAREIPGPGAGGRLELIFGERRLRAARQAGMEWVDVLVYPKGALADSDAADMRLTENLRRADLTHIELAEAFGALRDAGHSNQRIAERYHVSDDFVRKHTYLLRLAPPVRELLASGRLPVKQAELICRVGDHAKQVNLAGEVTNLSWNPRKKTWGDRHTVGQGGRFDPADYVMPAGELRQRLPWLMKTLGACGWPMDQEYAGRRPCAVCPDNTATEPTLFEGVNIPGTSRKGTCTNEACFLVKARAWEKVKAKRRAEKERKDKIRAAEARARGDCICGDCGRIAEPAAKGKPPDGWPKSDQCPKCKERADKRRDRYGGGPAGKPRRWPDTPEEHLDAALDEHGRELTTKLVEWIGLSLAFWTAEARTQRLELLCVLLVVQRATRSWGADVQIWSLEPDDDDDDGVEKLLARIAAGEAMAPTAEDLRTSVDALLHPIKGRGLHQHHRAMTGRDLAALDATEAVCRRYGIEVPDRPTLESVRARVEAARAKAQREALAKAIRTAKRPEALAAIAACADAALLAEVLAAGPRGKWRIAAIEGRRLELEQAVGEAE